MKKKQRNIVTFWQNIRRYFPYAVRSAKAELKSEVADSYLNWLWWIIEPFAFMLVYVFIFNYVFKNNTPYFASFVFIGQTLWGFFNRMVNGSCKLIMNNRGLVSKVYVPKYILLLSKSFVYLFKMAISLGLTFVIMAVQGVPLIWTFVFIIPIILTLYIVSFGISIILMHCGVFLNDLSNLVAIGMNLLFYLSGIFYNIRERLGEKTLLTKTLLHANPVAYCMDAMRMSLLEARIPSIKWIGIWLIIGITITIIGIRVIHKNENTYAKVI
jgi:teichoic acid transport system permease protein